MERMRSGIKYLAPGRTSVLVGSHFSPYMGKSFGLEEGTLGSELGKRKFRLGLSYTRESG